MSRWVPMPVDGWDETAALLSSTGQPWPEQAVVADLRWHFDTTKTLPSRRVLADRWGWGEKRARNFLATPERWWDASKGPAPTSREQAGAQQGPNRGPTGAQQLTVEPAKDDSKGPVGAQSGPSRGHTREYKDKDKDKDKEHLPILVPVEEQPDRWSAVVTYWSTKVAAAVGRPLQGPRTRTSKVGRRLATTLARCPEDVRDALRFIASSRSQRAAKLREYDGLTVETMLVHVEEYATLWRQEQAPPLPAPPTEVHPEAPPQQVVAPFVPPSRSRGASHEAEE